MSKKSIKGAHEILEYVDTPPNEKKKGTGVLYKVHCWLGGCTDTKIAVDNPLLLLSHCVKQQITKTPNRQRKKTPLWFMKTLCPRTTIGPRACITKLQYLQWSSLIYYIFTVIKVNVHNTVFYNPITDRWLVTVYMKCIYSVVFLKLCLNRCFQAQIQTKMQT